MSSDLNARDVGEQLAVGSIRGVAKWSSVATYVVLQIIATMTLLLGALGFAGYYFYQRQEWADFEAQTTLDAQRLALALEPSVWKFEHAEIRRLMADQIKDPKVVAVTVSTDLEHYALRRGVEGQLLYDQEGPYETNLVAKEVEIVRNGSSIGRLKVYFSTFILEGDLWHVRVFGFVVVALLDLLVSLMLYLLLRGVVLRPLGLIGHYADNVAHGNSLNTIPLEARFRGELGQLKTSIDDMVGQLSMQNVELNEANTMLDVRVQERTHELQASKSELERTLVSLKKAQDMLVQSEKLAGLGSVVVAVAHELNTPLGNCLTVATTLADKVEEMNKQVSSGNIRRSQLDEYFASVATGMTLIIDGLRQAAEQVSNFKQVAVNQENQQRRQFDLAAVVEGVAMLLNASLRKTPFVLELEVSEGLVMNSFPGPLEQIISNLVNNSVLHGFNGRAEGKMRLTAHREMDEIRIDYADDGVGMSENTLHRIYDPFFTTQLGKGGSGLGMTICYNLITGLLGGSIEVTSTIGTGSTFKILLPVEAPSLAEQSKDVNRTDTA